MDWKKAASALTPLLAHADGASDTGEDGVLAEIFRHVPAKAGFAVELGPHDARAATVSARVLAEGWRALYVNAPEAETLADQPQGIVARVRQVRERVSPDQLTALLERHDVPADLDCLVIGIGGSGFWAWASLGDRYRPSLVVIAFSPRVHPRVQATPAPDLGWNDARAKGQGASYAALCALAQRKGYRLIHVHGCWSLYFLRDDIAWPAALTVKQPLSDEEFARLTDPVSCFAQLRRGGAVPGAADEPAPDVSRSPWQLLPDEAPRQRVQLYDLAFEVLGNAHDPGWYQQRKTFEEKASLLYPLLAAEGFEQFVDVGANVGMVSLLARRANPALRVLAIEADPRLAALARRNFRAHGLDDAVLVNATAGDRDADAVPFSLNPNSSLDNRVVYGQWPNVHVPMRRLDGLLRRLGLDHGRTFFKIDTQGFELNVLRGLESVLTSRRDWLLKMEFAPDWLRSQGTDPLLLLDHLMLRYEVAEFPERIAFGTPSTAALFAHRLGVADQHRFLAHVQSLNKGGLGWVDLVLRPRQA